jgi:hypothetical protein
MNINEHDAREFTESIGQIVTGSYRQVALGIKLGVPKALGLSREEWVHQVGPVRLPALERKQAVAELTAPEEDGGLGLSQRAAADVLGVGHQTVRRDGSNEPPLAREQPASVLNGSNEPALFTAEELRNARELNARVGLANVCDLIERLNRTLNDDDVLTIAPTAGGLLPKRAAVDLLVSRLQSIYEGEKCRSTV